MTGERAWDMLATRYSVESAETGQVLSISITSRKRPFGARGKNPTRYGAAEDPSFPPEAARRPRVYGLRIIQTREQ